MAWIATDEANLSWKVLLTIWWNQWWIHVSIQLVNILAAKPMRKFIQFSKKNEYCGKYRSKMNICTYTHFSKKNQSLQISTRNNAYKVFRKRQSLFKGRVNFPFKFFLSFITFHSRASVSCTTFPLQQFLFLLSDKI